MTERHHLPRLSPKNRQFFIAILAIIGGGIIGILSAVLFWAIGWYSVILGVIGAVLVGRLASGSVTAKAIRLFLFGLFATLVFLSYLERTNVWPNLALSVSGGIAAVLIGAVVHLMMRLRKPGPVKNSSPKANPQADSKVDSSAS